ncbi:MAG TPA: hypothetical protein EYN67_16815 [Flavobacteriales bacterium]|nr:hypothetical protein [Flavobacteriales bacterium]
MLKKPEDKSTTLSAGNKTFKELQSDEVMSHYHNHLDVEGYDKRVSHPFEPLAYTQTFKRSSIQNAPYDVQHRYKSLDVWSILNEYVNFVIAPEATTTGNVHYHGIIISIIRGQKRRWLNEVLPALKKLGFINLKPIHDLVGWVNNYMLKDAKEHTYMGEEYLTKNFTATYEPTCSYWDRCGYLLDKKVTKTTYTTKHNTIKFPKTGKQPKEYIKNNII